MGVVKNPVLRFKNDKGEDYPDWESKRLGEIGELLKSGNSFNPEFQGNTTDTIPFIKVSDFNHIENNIYIFKYNNTVSQQLATKNSYYIFPRNTIIFAKVGEALRLNRKKLLNIPTIIDNNLMGLYFNEDKNNIFFIYYSFLLINIEEYSNGGTLPSINNKSVYEIPIPIPHIEEQNKIGKFLKAVDDKIEITNQKLTSLKQYKTALMQQLFPQNNQTNPSLRFKNDKGENYPDWESKRLGEIGELLKGQGLSKSQINITGKNKCILYGEIFTTYENTIENVVSKTDKDLGKKSKSGDILMPSSTTTTAIDLIKAVMLKESNVLLGGDIIIIRNTLNLYDSLFLMYFLNYNRKELSKKAQGITIIHLYPNQLIDSSIPIPHIEEQNKIGKFLKSVDDKIEITNQKLKHLKTYKTALMQQLFPSTH